MTASSPPQRPSSWAPERRAPQNSEPGTGQPAGPRAGRPAGPPAPDRGAAGGLAAFLVVSELTPRTRPGRQPGCRRGRGRASSSAGSPDRQRRGWAPTAVLAAAETQPRHWTTQHAPAPPTRAGRAGRAGLAGPRTRRNAAQPLPPRRPRPASTPNPDARPAAESRYSLNSSSNRTLMSFTAGARPRRWRDGRGGGAGPRSSASQVVDEGGEIADR